MIASISEHSRLDFSIVRHVYALSLWRFWDILEGVLVMHIRVGPGFSFLRLHHKQKLSKHLKNECRGFVLKQFICEVIFGDSM